MILYHVSQDMAHDGIFVPRIPKDRLVGEDCRINRICMSSSILGCFSSMPCGGNTIDCYWDDSNSIYKIFRIDTEKYGVNYMTPEELIKKELVMDAELTQEYWILDKMETKSEDIFYIHLNTWDYVSYGYTSKIVLDILKERNITFDEFTKCSDFNDDYYASVSVIKDLIYTTSEYGEPLVRLASMKLIPFDKILSQIPGVEVIQGPPEFTVVLNDNVVDANAIYELIGRINSWETSPYEHKIGETVYLRKGNKPGKRLALTNANYEKCCSRKITDLKWAILLDIGSIVYEYESELLEKVA